MYHPLGALPGEELNPDQDHEAWRPYLTQAGKIRKRIGVACNRCRKRRIKCIPQAGTGCLHCQNSGNLTSCQAMREKEVPIDDENLSSLLASSQNYRPPPNLPPLVNPGIFQANRSQTGGTTRELPLDQGSYIKQEDYQMFASLGPTPTIHGSWCSHLPPMVQNGQQIAGYYPQHPTASGDGGGGAYPHYHYHYGDHRAAADTQGTQLPPAQMLLGHDGPWSAHAGSRYSDWRQ